MTAEEKLDMIESVLSGWVENRKTPEPDTKSNQLQVLHYFDCLRERLFLERVAKIVREVRAK